MNKQILKDEQLCLQVKILTDIIRTKLFEIESLPLSEYRYWNSRLKKLKSEIDTLYWNL